MTTQRGRGWPAHRFGLRECLGGHPPGAQERFSLDRSGYATAGQWRKVFSGNSTYMAIYAGVLAFVASFYGAFRPSLWYSFGWLANAALDPVAVCCAFWSVLEELERFLNVMAPDARGALSRFKSNEKRPNV